MIGETWLKQRTFHHSEFNVRELVELKRAQGLTISLCLPTLNEERTVGKIVRILKSRLMDRIPLIDEIGVVDSGSTDRTKERALRAGAQFFAAADCLPEMGAVRGKGENLWKSLHLFSGDIIVWVDADIRNIHPKFVYGLVGPILKNPEIGYVKAFYQRPIRVGRVLKPGGGRVTELLVRPFLSMLFPQLSMLAQPLSGEYAGRRTLLERVPFLSNYGVEIGLLIDLEKQFGMGSIAQTDMDLRIHRNQDIASLRRMAYAILSVLMSRSAQAGKFAILEGLGQELQTIKQQGFEYFKDAETVAGTERPPMITLPEYQMRRGISEEDAAYFRGLPTQALGQGISHLVRPHRIRLELRAQTRDAAIHELVSSCKSELGALDPGTLASDLILREKKMSTNMGHGIAVPHLVGIDLPQTLILVGRSKRGIDFDSRIIRRPVHLIFVILAPEQDRGIYLENLAALARILKNRKLVQSLVDASTEESFVSTITKFEAMAKLQGELGMR